MLYIFQSYVLIIIIIISWRMLSQLPMYTGNESIYCAKTYFVAHLGLFDSHYKSQLARTMTQNAFGDDFSSYSSPIFY